MNTSWTPIKTAVTLALCSAAIAFAPAQAAGQGAAATPARPAAATMLPGDDFYAWANGQWMAQTEIPADRGSWGAMAALAEESNARIVKLIEEAAANKAATGEARKVADFYTAYMNEAAIETAGLAALKPRLAKIDGVKDRAQLSQLLGEFLRADVDPLNSTNFNTPNLFGVWFNQSLTDPSRNVPYLLQGGIGLPDRAYYLDNSPKMAELRTKYQQYIAGVLKLAGYDNAETRAARIFALESELAESHASREESSDILKANNTWSMKDFSAKAPGMDWKAFMKGARLGGQDRFIAYHPGAIKGAAEQVRATDLATWKDYLAFHTLNQFSGTLPKAYVDLRFEFYGKTLTGSPQQSVRWKRALAATNGAMDEAVGKMYVAKHFSAADKARIQKMVADIKLAFERRIDKLDWMAPSTRAQAKEKVRTMYVGVGYPDEWKTYGGLQVSSTDALGNVLRAQEFHYGQQLAKLKQKPKKTDWSMPPQLVNAVNLPLQNALNFPAAILQAPFYDAKASDAQNYGAIGAVIGHEISHSFDDMGAQFDAQGRLRDWWTKEDLAHFKQASHKLVEQYNTYKPFDDLAVNGQLTLSENLSDLAGLAAAYDAFKVSPSGKGTGVEADRAFFTGFAHAWRTKMREASLRRTVLTDGHAPGQYRTSTVRNLDAWYKAFDVQPGQAMYLAPEQRVRVW
ncbi:M13 family metallopeptidase [Massilia yuzhufengensis]|uniref:Endothelin-converting enzyme Metallo peptidase. MEROPS family M13 n=1 Tax=Massilia yuzhufengensis TaxID=1164594 RepID=A0A1I1SP40_9BURK|nr:M13 family metallopeptidase [Massilia yuzhufengensis]SFD48131.1 endothelin-converting enzyme Metallo peptidase. MEROPS family M13 [Massilia yuzhufengensis]